MSNRPMSRAGLLAVPLFSLVLAASAAAQTRWQYRLWGPTRAGHAMAYDAARKRIVVYGGDAGYSYGEPPHWEYDGVTWTGRNLAVRPPWTSGAAMAYDAARQNIVLFGGANGQPNGETWIWDGSTWQQQSPATAPPARYGHSMVFDSARGRVIMFGGGNGDMWEWDGTSWTQIAATPLPPDRWNASMAYDPRRDRVLLFGGTDGSICLGDTWEWDGTSWHQLFPANSPSPRWSAPTVYDAARQRIVLYGGRCSNALTQTWEWDGADWVRRNATASTRLDPAGAYDSDRRVMVLHGGWDCPPGFPECSVAGDTWEYGPTWPASYSPFGSGCAGAVGTPALAPVPGSLPWVGAPLELQLTGIAAATIGIVGSSETTWGPVSLPLGLGVVGSPGCLLYTGAEVSVVLSNANGTADWTIPIPAVSELAGRTFYVQGLELGPAGIAVSDAGRVTMGLR